MANGFHCIYQCLFGTSDGGALDRLEVLSPILLTGAKKRTFFLSPHTIDWAEIEVHDMPRRPAAGYAVLDGAATPPATPARPTGMNACEAKNGTAAADDP